MSNFHALLADLTSTPWAIRAETLDALAAFLANPRHGGGAVARRPYLVGEDGPEMFLTADQVARFEAAIHPATEKATARKPGAVAVIPVKGVITNRASMFDILFGGGAAVPSRIIAQARAALADDAVKAIVLDVDSPGGSVFGVAEAADQLRAMRGKKPIVAQVTGQCCSAAYHIAAAADEIVVQPSSMVGSIGVYMVHVDYSGMNEAMGVKVTYVHAGKHKVEGNADAPLDKDAEAHLQEMADDYMKLFVDGVAAGRGVTASVARGPQFGEGRTYIGSRAVERGLADKVRTFDDTLAAYGIAGTAVAGPARRTAVALASRRMDLQG